MSLIIVFLIHQNWLITIFEFEFFYSGSCCVNQQQQLQKQQQQQKVSQSKNDIEPIEVVEFESHFEK